MNNWFKKGALMGSIMGATVGIFAASRMNPRQRRKMMRNTRKTFTNIKDGDRKSTRLNSSH